MEGDDLCVFDMILALFRRSKLGILCHILCWMYLHFGSESWIKKDTRRGAKPMGLMRLCGMVVYNSACAYCIIYILLVIAFNCLAFWIYKILPCPSCSRDGGPSPMPRA